LTQVTRGRAAVADVITAVVLIGVIFLLGVTFGYLVALFAGRRK
jgi:hypothetical protein